MNYYSYNPQTGMAYFETKTQAKEAAEAAMQQQAHIHADQLHQITWGEVTERAAISTGFYALRRQERLSYEAQHPQVVDGRMQDADGNLILVKNIPDADLLEHDLVLSIACIWEAQNGRLARFKQYCFEDVSTFLDLLFERYQAKRGGSEGNITLTTVDKRWKVNIAIQKAVDFGPEIEVAKVKMLEAVREMGGINNDLETIVTAAFTQIDGKLRVAEILRLRSYKVENATWNEAMAIINDAIEVISRKKQIRLYQRNDQGQYDALPLNIAAL